MAKNARIFLLESPNSLDLLEGRGERSSLENICSLFGHDVTSFLLRDANEFFQSMRYLGAVVHHPEPGSKPLFIHISAHGNSDGVKVGADEVSWNKLAKMLSKTYLDLDEYEGPIVLIISACGANDRELTERIAKKYKKDQIDNPPEYVFVFSEDTVSWRDAVVTWTIFYRRVNRLEFLSDKKEDIGEIQKLLRRIANCGFGPLTYFRWDRSEYKRYDGQD